MYADVIIAVAFLGVLFAAGIWDVIAEHGNGNTSTVSDVIMTWSTRYPLVPLSVGLIMGHLFWSKK